MSVFIARTPAELERLRRPWTRLQQACPSTLFQSFEWNLLAARHFAGREPLHVVYAEAGAGAALVPTCESCGALAFLGEALFDYRRFLHIGGSALALAWEALAELGLPLSVTAVPRDWAGEWSDLPLLPFSAAPYVRRRDLSADAFVRAHKWSRRLLPRLNRLGAHLRRHSGASADLGEWLYREKASQPAGHGPNLFADPCRREFMRALLALEPSRWEIFTLEAGSRIVAALATFLDGAVRRFYTVVHDREWDTHSPGAALMFEVTRLSLAAGLDCDYLTGEQEHKNRLTSTRVPLFRVQASADQVAAFARGLALPAAA